MQHHRQADDLRARFKAPEWGAFCHTARLRNRPARLKLVLSDSTGKRVVIYQKYGSIAKPSSLSDTTSNHPNLETKFKFLDERVEFYCH